MGPLQENLPRSKPAPRTGFSLTLISIGPGILRGLKLVRSRLDRASMRHGRQPHHLPARGRRLSLDRLRVLQGHRLGSVQDAPRADPNAQRHDARPAWRQDEMRSVRQAPGAILPCKPERHARGSFEAFRCHGPAASTSPSPCPAVASSSPSKTPRTITSQGRAGSRGVAGRGRSPAPGCRTQRPDHDGAHRHAASIEPKRPAGV
jgi:hypothetical protein